MSTEKIDSNIAILLVVLGASEHELATARTFITGAEQTDCLFTLCDENTSTTVDKVLRDKRWDMVCFTAAEGCVAMEQALLLSKITKARGALSVVATICKSWSPAEYLSDHNMNQAYVLDHTDSLLLIPEEQVYEKHFYSLVDDFLSSIRNLLDENGFINLDFPDVCAVLKDSCVAFFASHTVKGECAGEREHHLNKNEFMPGNVFSASGSCLFCIWGCMDIGLEDVEAVATQVRQQLSPDALMIFGALFDDCLVNEMKVIVLTAGFDM